MHHTHVLLCKNFLQGDEEQQQSTKSPSNLPSAEDEDDTAAPTDSVIPPVTNGGGPGGDDNKDEVMADVEHQKTPDGRRNVTGADDKEDAAVSTGANDKNGE